MAYRTAFSPAHTNMIHAAIAKLAERTNYYFAPRSVSYPELLAMTLPVKDHAEALMLPRKYGQYLSLAVFRANLNFHGAQYNAKLVFSMDMTGPGVFAVEPREREPQDTEESATFRGKLDQWVDNATRIGFVRYMFEVANDTAYPGDKRYVRYLLPGIVPLLKSVGLTDLATRLAPPARDVMQAGRLAGEASVCHRHQRCEAIIHFQILCQGQSEKIRRAAHQQNPVTGGAQLLHLSQSGLCQTGNDPALQDIPGQR